MKKEQTVTIKDTGAQVEIYVLSPSNEIISAADLYRAKVWNQCLQDGVIIKKELSVLMEQRGIWNKDKSDKEDSIGTEIQALEKKLYRGEKNKRPKVSDGKQIAVAMRKLRLDLRELIAERLAMEENTAEALSDNARFDYFVAECTFYKEGDRRVYADLDEYKKRSSDEIAFAAASMLGDILYNLDSSFEANLPENQWLKAFDLVDEDLSLVNTEGELVDSQGRKVNDLGHFLDENGNRVDADGIPLNDNGNYIMVDYENDLVPKKKKTTSRAKKTTTAKQTTTES